LVFLRRHRVPTYREPRFRFNPRRSRGSRIAARPQARALGAPRARRGGRPRRPDLQHSNRSLPLDAPSRACARERVGGREAASSRRTADLRDRSSRSYFARSTPVYGRRLGANASPLPHNASARRVLLAEAPLPPGHRRPRFLAYRARSFAPRPATLNSVPAEPRQSGEATAAPGTSGSILTDPQRLKSRLNQAR
jgi:hypothetical protein